MTYTTNSDGSQALSHEAVLGRLHRSCAWDDAIPALRKRCADADFDLEFGCALDQRHVIHARDVSRRAGIRMAAACDAYARGALSFEDLIAARVNDVYRAHCRHQIERLVRDRAKGSDHYELFADCEKFECPGRRYFEVAMNSGLWSRAEILHDIRRWRNAAWVLQEWWDAHPKEKADLEKPRKRITMAEQKRLGIVVKRTDRRSKHIHN